MTIRHFHIENTPQQTGKAKDKKEKDNLFSENIWKYRGKTLPLQTKTYPSMDEPGF
ncbi:MAG: hypothetical protein MR301_00795 [Prevotella sp.]|nr:hypothetical protein [Prevotella sp.]MDY5546414.1 hypothetical protein [Prevotella sp.]